MCADVKENKQFLETWGPDRQSEGALITSLGGRQLAAGGLATAQYCRSTCRQIYKASLASSKLLLSSELKQNYVFKFN